MPFSGVVLTQWTPPVVVHNSASDTLEEVPCGEYILLYIPKYMPGVWSLCVSDRWVVGFWVRNWPPRE